MSKKLPPEMQEIKDAAEADLETFIRLVAPYQFIPSFHKEIINWWTREDASQNQLLLIPRDHGKSRLVAFYVAWLITRNPAIRVLYISATSNLAEKQLGLIKTILTSPQYTRYWVDMVHSSFSKREKWTNAEICVDHPKRKEEGVRDPTVFTAGLTTSITGLHCDIAVLDDIVVAENAMTEEGRNRVRNQYSLLSSIEGADSKEIVVGTRYHPSDLYQDLMDMKEIIYDKDGDKQSEKPIYELFQRQLEDVGDGTGQYLWARDKTADGKWFGFDQQIRARKYAQYLDKRQFWAQYYNTPNPPGEMSIDSSKFQYYEKRLLRQENGQWEIAGQRLNVTAAIDFAFSTKNKADFTAIVVVGVDSRKRIYVLDIIRFKTDRISDYFKHIQAAYLKWGFRKLRAEVTSGQATIVKELKENYFKPYGLPLAVDEHKPTRHNGTKAERIAAILESRYDNLLIYHYREGNCQLLEEELLTEFPAHDDIKDALANAIEIAIPPALSQTNSTSNTVVYNRKFGGCA